MPRRSRAAVNPGDEELVMPDREFSDSRDEMEQILRDERVGYPGLSSALPSGARQGRSGRVESDG